MEKIIKIGKRNFILSYPDELICKVKVIRIGKQYKVITLNGQRVCGLLARKKYILCETRRFPVFINGYRLRPVIDFGRLPNNCVGKIRRFHNRFALYILSP